MNNWIALTVTNNINNKGFLKLLEDPYENSRNRKNYPKEWGISVIYPKYNLEPFDQEEEDPITKLKGFSSRVQAHSSR